MLSKSRVYFSSSQSKSNTSSSSSVSRKRVDYYFDLLLTQSHERFKRKTRLLEKQKFLELELERKNIIEAENQLKLLELKDDHNLDK